MKWRKCSDKARPMNDIPLLVIFHARSNGTSGDQDRGYYCVKSFYTRKPYGVESASFVDGFFVLDYEIPYHHVKAVYWAEIEMPDEIREIMLKRAENAR